MNLGILVEFRARNSIPNKGSIRDEERGEGDSKQKGASYYGSDG